jgi:hypothetical protein
LTVRAKIYAAVGTEPTLWKVREGKEVFRSITSQIGFSDAETAERAIMGVWSNDPSLIPDELRDLRDCRDGWDEPAQARLHSRAGAMRLHRARSG